MLFSSIPAFPLGAVVEQLVGRFVCDDSFVIDGLQGRVWVGVLHASYRCVPTT